MNEKNVYYIQEHVSKRFTHLNKGFADNGTIQPTNLDVLNLEDVAFTNSTEMQNLVPQVENKHKGKGCTEGAEKAV